MIRNACMHAWVRVCMRGRASACVCACGRACGRAGVRACGREGVCAGVCACVPPPPNGVHAARSGLYVVRLGLELHFKNSHLEGFGGGGGLQT